MFTMAVLIHLATVTTTATIRAMENPVIPPKSAISAREKAAESRLAALFEKAGWHVRRPSRADSGADLLVRRKEIEYAVEIKSAPEGRSDRLVPLFAQAVLQAA